MATWETDGGSEEDSDEEGPTVPSALAQRQLWHSGLYGFQDSTVSGFKFRVVQQRVGFGTLIGSRGLGCRMRMSLVIEGALLTTAAAAGKSVSLYPDLCKHREHHVCTLYMSPCHVLHNCVPEP